VRVIRVVREAAGDDHVRALPVRGDEDLGVEAGSFANEGAGGARMEGHVCGQRGLELRA
jgi:hypothetical protein